MKQSLFIVVGLALTLSVGAQTTDEEKKPEKKGKAKTEEKGQAVPEKSAQPNPPTKTHAHAQTSEHGTTMQTHEGGRQTRRLMPLSIRRRRLSNKAALSHAARRFSRMDIRRAKISVCVALRAKRPMFISQSERIRGIGGSGPIPLCRLVAATITRPIMATGIRRMDLIRAAVIR